MPTATGRLSQDGAVAVGTVGAPAVDGAAREFRGAERHVIAPLLGASPEGKSHGRHRDQSLSAATRNCNGDNTYDVFSRHSVKGAFIQVPALRGWDET